MTVPSRTQVKKRYPYVNWKIEASLVKVRRKFVEFEKRAPLKKEPVSKCLLSTHPGRHCLIRDLTDVAFSKAFHRTEQAARKSMLSHGIIQRNAGSARSVDRMHASEFET